MKMKNYYDELEVSRYASPEIINKAYKVLAKKYHPDTTTEDKQQAEERFKKISEAYEILSDEQKRLEYDNTLPPEIDIEHYHEVLEDNQRLSSELLNLKSTIDSLRNHQYTTYTDATNHHSPQSNLNYQQYDTTNYDSPYYTENYTASQNSQSYSFIDIVKLKIKRFLFSLLRLVLKLISVIMISSIALYLLYYLFFVRRIIF